MGIETAIIAAVSIAATAYSQNKQHQAQKAAAKSQKKAAATQQAQQDNNQQEQTRQQIRDSRIKRAQIEAASTNSGTSDSSGEIGAMNNVSMGLANQMSYTNSNKQATDGINYWNNKAAKQTENANHWGNIGQLAGAAGDIGIAGVGAYDAYTGKGQKTQIDPSKMN